MKEEEEEKKEDNDDDEEIEGKRRDKGGYAGQPGGGKRHDVQIPLGQFCHLSPSHAAHALRFFLQGRTKTATPQRCKKKHHESTGFPRDTWPS